MCLQIADSLDVDVCECGELVVGPMTAHRFECHEPKFAVFVCPQCGCEFVSERELGVHLHVIENITGFYVSAYKRPLLSSFVKLQRCRLCSFQCEQTRTMNDHVAVEHPKPPVGKRASGRGRGLLAPPDSRGLRGSRQ